MSRGAFEDDVPRRRSDRSAAFLATARAGAVAAAGGGTRRHVRRTRLGQQVAHDDDQIARRNPRRCTFSEMHNLAGPAAAMNPSRIADSRIARRERKSPNALIRSSLTITQSIRTLHASNGPR